MCKTDSGEGGGGGKNVPKINYVISERPFIARRGFTFDNKSLQYHRNVQANRLLSVLQYCQVSARVISI